MRVSKPNLRGRGPIGHPGTLAKPFSHPSKSAALRRALGNGSIVVSLRGRIGFDWSMVMPAASRGWGRSSSLNSQPKNKEQQYVGSRCLINGTDVVALTSTRGRQRH